MSDYRNNENEKLKKDAVENEFGEKIAPKPEKKENKPYFQPRQDTDHQQGGYRPYNPSYQKRTYQRPQLPPRGMSPSDFNRQQYQERRDIPRTQSNIRDNVQNADYRSGYSKPYYRPQTDRRPVYNQRQYDKPSYDRQYQKPVYERSYSRPDVSDRYREQTVQSTDQQGDVSYHSNHRAVKRIPLKIIPLGGLNEIGKNMTVFECGNDMFIVDCGLAFPDSDMPGVDLVIPDFTYVEQNASKIRGIVITHGHEDHIGGLAYLLKKINIPVYATRLTVGLIEGKLKEHNLFSQTKLNVVTPRQTVKMGCMAVEFIRVNHSIPDAVGLAIHTPAGIVIHTGDFKVDYTPIDGGIIDLARFGELGNRGVLALMADSTNAERPGHTASERKVGESFERLFVKAEGKRIIIATFASNIHRIQQIINNAVKNDRKVAVFGRSMLNVISAAMELGYLSVPDGVIIDIEAMNTYPADKIVLITTGSQGEPMSALTRMAMNEHRSVTITPMDYIIISANPIPGNEKFVTKVVNELLKAGAEVVYESMYDVHVSGHACQEELKLIMALSRPKFFIPVHGEYKHLKKNAGLAYSLGIPESSVVIGEIGDVIETDGASMNVTGKVPAGKVLVDGLGVGDVGSIVLRDRKHLAEDGLIVVVATIESESNTILAGPDILSRGFVYVRESEEMMEAAKDVLKKTLEECLTGGVRDWNSIKSGLRDALSDYIYMKTKRSPMILPIIEEI
ncbi:MAG: ribonuclease J [Ruminococcus sp.]|nr:ribonuclease J [Ruminococcus sp.]